MLKINIVVVAFICGILPRTKYTRKVCLYCEAVTAVLNVEMMTVVLNIETVADFLTAEMVTALLYVETMSSWCPAVFKRV